MIDLRSDTLTKPTPGMLAAMAAAPVGDDVYGEDPTVNALEAKVATFFGHEAAVFFPTGTMANQVAIRTHCEPGDEILIESTSHIVLWEAGGVAVHSGATCRPIDGTHGLLTAAQLEGKLRPDDMHSVRTRLVSLENTHNRGGGTIYPLETVAAISAWARSNGLAMHLDGARLWNAIVASGVSGPEWGRHFDTIMVAFSKGLGAPVGSALVGSTDLMRKARRLRKLFGGAMRQVGYLAAACIHGMDHHLDRLADDHANARLLADAVGSVPGFTLTPADVRTNMVWFEVDPRHGSAQAVVAKLREQNVRASALDGQTIRMCTHLDVGREECERAAQVIRRIR
ncbi:low-specificity L-threonine aldolase [Limnoglobus roseus]|uniref:Low-specificity L-threonine aldolase n=1 Tax=Limnoglobus roseus TaxID=2598579 RepID=A0A5C1AFI1_9BACT|nr:low-specificity L-threonine aldolase [Limnoglobus roseus]QEL18179.1 low-specificity L-threonine aldolase [Limnoglobus roseus]